MTIKAATLNAGQADAGCESLRCLSASALTCGTFPVDTAGNSNVAPWLHWWSWVVC